MGYFVERSPPTFFANSMRELKSRFPPRAVFALKRLTGLSHAQLEPARRWSSQLFAATSESTPTVCRSAIRTSMILAATLSCTPLAFAQCAPWPATATCLTCNTNCSYTAEVSRDGCAVAMGCYASTAKLRWPDSSLDISDSSIPWVHVLGVSAHGDAAVGGQTPNPGAIPWRAFVFVPGVGFHVLNPPVPGLWARAWDCSSDLLTVVGAADTTPPPQLFGDAPTVWNRAVGTVELLPLPPGDWLDGAARAVTPDGRIIVGSVQNLQPTFFQGGPGRACLWTDGVLSVLPHLSAHAWSVAWEVSPDGNHIVGASTREGGSSVATMWVGAGAPIDLGVHDGYPYSIALGVSADGRLAVGRSFFTTSQPPLPNRAFIWEDGVFYDLKEYLNALGLQFASVTDCSGISDDGRKLSITADGHGWLVTLPPRLSPFDLTGDGIVNGGDLGVLLGAWGQCSSCTADFNEDGLVDGADLGALLGAWTG